MILFFNDTFLEKEFIEFDKERFFSSCNSFFEICTEIKKKKLQYSSQSIYLKCSKSAIESFFKELNKKDLEVLFLQSLAKVNVKYWDVSGRIQDENYNYFFYNTSLNPPTSEHINNSSLAEAAEVIKRGNSCVLTINLPDLLFSINYQLNINVISRISTQDVKLIIINCTDNFKGLSFWIDSFFDERLMYKDYDRTPLDNETCLINNHKFSKIEGCRIQGRQVYLDIHNRFWYVDNDHKGVSAHIEVFDKNHKHIGESDLKGIIDYSKQVPGRTITV